MVPAKVEAKETSISIWIEAEVKQVLDDFHSFTLSLLASPQDQRASAADTIVSNIVIKNNLFLSEQSLFFENLIWFDHILFHPKLIWAGKRSWREKLQILLFWPWALSASE